MGIVVVGSVFVDIKGYPNKNYNPSGRNAGFIKQVHGGVSRNIAEDIAKVELHPIFVGLADDSGTGADVVANLERSGVDTRFMRRTPDGMGTWMAIFDGSGDVCAQISKRPDLSYISNIIEEHGNEIFSSCDSIAFEMDLEKEVISSIYKYAEIYGKKTFAAVSNMTVAMERRDLLQYADCFVCNQEEAGIFFADDYSELEPEQMLKILTENIEEAKLPRMVITMGEKGSVYAEAGGESGICPALKVDVTDTTGAGDAFFAGVTIGLTYGKTLRESCRIGTRLASAVIGTSENVCPRFLPGEFGINIKEGVLI